MPQTLRANIWPLVAILVVASLAYSAGSEQHLVADGFAFVQGPLRIQYIPDPNDIVNLTESTPHTVPAGKVLIITDWVATDASTIHPCCSVTITPRIYVDGQAVWGGGYAFGSDPNGSSGSTGTSTLTGSLRSGIRVDAGQTVTLAALASSEPPGFSSPVVFAAGYLAPATPM